MSNRVRERLIAAYRDLTIYWMSPRVIIGWQTVDFVSERARHCASLLAHYSNGGN